MLPFASVSSQVIVFGLCRRLNAFKLIFAPFARSLLVCRLKLIKFNSLCHDSTVVGFRSRSVLSRHRYQSILIVAATLTFFPSNFFSFNFWKILFIFRSWNRNRRIFEIVSSTLTFATTSLTSSSSMVECIRKHEFVCARVCVDCAIAKFERNGCTLSLINSRKTRWCNLDDDEIQSQVGPKWTNQIHGIANSEQLFLVHAHALPSHSNRLISIFMNFRACDKCVGDWFYCHPKALRLPANKSRITSNWVT